MPPKKKKGGAKYMEKMLFVNHKEDQHLQVKLEQLHLRSRDREIEMDLAKNKVENEWRQSRKRQITIQELNRALGNNDQINAFSPQTATMSRKKRSSARMAQDLSVNDYLIEEHRKLSSVIPEILTALTASKGKDSPKLVQVIPREHDNTSVDPDIHKIIKMTQAVKTLRKNISTKMKANDLQPKLTVVLSSSDNTSDLNTYTNGACALMKRKIDKKRKKSNSNYELPPSMQRKLAALEKQMSDPRRHSVIGGVTDISRVQLKPKRHSVCVPQIQRSQSTSVLPPISAPGINRSLTTLSNKSAFENLILKPTDGNSGTIDEDELRARQKIALELQRYDDVKCRITSFLDNKTKVIKSNMYIDSI